MPKEVIEEQVDEEEEFGAYFNQLLGDDGVTKGENPFAVKQQAQLVDMGEMGEIDEEVVGQDMAEVFAKEEDEYVKLQ